MTITARVVLAVLSLGVLAEVRQRIRYRKLWPIKSEGFQMLRYAEDQAWKDEVE